MTAVPSLGWLWHTEWALRGYKVAPAATLVLCGHEPIKSCGVSAGFPLVPGSGSIVAEAGAGGWPSWKAAEGPCAPLGLWPRGWIGCEGC